jgi:hypothetical protein
MRKLSTILLATLAVTAALQLGQAHASVYVLGDAMRLKGPGVTANGIYGQIAVRNASGTLFTKNFAPTVSGWAAVNAPPGGVASGPSMTTRNGSFYMFVRGYDGNVWFRSSANGAWSSAFGAPAVGVGSAPSAASVGSDILVSVIGNDNRPYVRRMLSNNSLDAWTAVGTNSAIVVPGVALSSTLAGNIYMIDGNEKTIDSRCVYMACWTPWQYFSNGLANEGFSAAGYALSSGYFRISVAVRGLDNMPWVALSTDDGASFGNFVPLGGGAIDAAPAVSYFSPLDRAVVVTHRSDGNYYYFNGNWLNMGHP